MVDKNVFLHELAAVTLLRKGDSHYLKEWLDYHLVAGVDHFIIYDATGNDDVHEILQPYFENQQVDYFNAPNESEQVPPYNDAVSKFKYVCRYMTFLAVDEFIFPKNNLNIVETVDEILSDIPQAVALAVNWQVFGSNDLEKADYSVGVLERFTSRAQSDWYEDATDETLPVGNIHVTTIANPRYIRYIVNPHFAYYCNGSFAVNSDGEYVPYWGNKPVLSDKIVVNAYVTKSAEEYQVRHDDMTDFEKNNRNDVKDDSIIGYRDTRAHNYIPKEKFNREKCFAELEKILLFATRKNVPKEFFEGKLEMFLTCRALAEVLRFNFPRDKRGRSLENLALRALNRTFENKITLAEIMLMFDALPHILTLPYDVVDEIYKNCINLINQLIKMFYNGKKWQNFVDMQKYLDLMKAFGRQRSIAKTKLTATLKTTPK
ncbi:MAG: glycosyltransferase family 92 protein [Selenomonadaceae bacterium]|nr:glycosyltransferase family 92 protein [Selenomonadaceae bacterium]